MFLSKKALGMTAAALVLLVGVAGQVKADPITTLFSTGVDGAGNVLPGGSIDPHYTVDFGSGPLTPFVVNDPASLGWIGNTPGSAWISTDPSGFPPNTVNTYTTTFNLNGLDASSAVINGFMSTDDFSNVFLNGNLAVVGDNGNSPWAHYQFWSITSGFVSGVNTLTFVTPDDGGGPGGLQVNMTGTANAAPEPASLALLGMGGLLGVVRARRRK